MLDSRYIIGRMHCVNGSFSLHHIGIVGFFLWRFFFSPTFQYHVDILFVFFSFVIHGSVQVAWAATYCCSTQLDHDFVLQWAQYEIRVFDFCVDFLLLLATFLRSPQY